jgi:arsenate reductase
MVQRILLIAAFLCALPITGNAGQPNPSAERQVLFVCEHGNVKSLMAASYFNALAKARHLPFRAVSRGVAPDSDGVPDFVRTPLATEGFNVSNFHPQRMTRDDVAASERVVVISTAVPPDASSAVEKVEQWNDVPPASKDYEKSRDSIKLHVAELVDRLARVGAAD